MEQSKFYSVIAGRKEPATALQGQLSKSSGQPTGATNKIKLPVGTISIPNFSRVWGRRVINASTPDNRKGNARVAVSDPKYTGTVEFMKYGADGGEVIEIRYVPGSGTLDKLYQDTIQKVKPNDEDAFLNFRQGINNYDADKQPLLVQMIKNHTLNDDSISKNPDNTEYDLVEFNPQKRNQSRIQEINTKNTAEGYVLNARDDKGRIMILASIFGIDSKQQDEVIIDQLLDRATEYPKEFVKAVMDYQNKVHMLIEDAVEANVIILEPDGELKIVGETSRDTVLEGVEGKGSDQIVWITTNVITDADVFDAIKKVDDAFKQYKKQFA